MNGKLAQKVDDTLEIVQAFREGSSVVGNAVTLVELREIKETLHVIHRNKWSRKLYINEPEFARIG